MFSVGHFKNKNNSLDRLENIQVSSQRVGHSTMVRARSFANVTACRVVSNPAWCSIFREISCFSPVNIGTLFPCCCVLGQSTLPSNAPLDKGEIEYLVGQRWQCV